jgi:plasmid stabilization system protein ParE
MYVLEYSSEAKLDIGNIAYWIAEEKGMPDTAFEYMNRLSKAIKEMAKHPMAYSIRTSPSAILKYGLNVRRMNFEKLAILFVIKDDNTIYIHRIIASKNIYDS